jgi:hypothetical protein
MLSPNLRGRLAKLTIVARDGCIAVRSVRRLHVDLAQVAVALVVPSFD